MLVKLLSRLHNQTIDAGVVSLKSRGPISDEIEALGVSVWHLSLKRLWYLPYAIVKLARIVRRFQPNVIQGWMYHGNLAALVARHFAYRRSRLIWGVRQTLYDLRREKLGTRLTIQLGAKLSGLPDAILFNSETARTQHEVAKYITTNAIVIDNGFDINVYQPDSLARFELRKELKLNPTAPLIGLVARFHPMKSHETFLRAAEIIAERIPEVHFILVGRGVEPSNPFFASWKNMSSLDNRLHLLGERNDIPRLTAALDIASISSSWGEAFPNAIGEAMSCGVPCVATNVGDVKRIIADTGVVVPIGDSGAMAKAWEKLFLGSQTERFNLGMAARTRVLVNFSLERIADYYSQFYIKEAS